MRHLLLAGLLGLAGCNALSPDPGPDHVARVAEWLSGSFSSAEQAAAQPDDYFDIRLEVVPIWTDREDGPWLYVEQAAAAALERPYRQRVYHVVQTEEGPRSDVYTLPGDPLAYAGAWQEPARFDGITPDTLALREGCSIYLTAEGEGAYVGSTRGEGCSSNLADAAYATSEVRVEGSLLTSWDRGFDAGGQQVWGAEKGPYAFVRVLR